jgi:hypothetical protein
VFAREPATALQELASAIENSAWDLAVATVEEGLLDDQVPSLQRLGRLGQLGDMPTFIAELGRSGASSPSVLPRSGWRTCYSSSAG